MMLKWYRKFIQKKGIAVLAILLFLIFPRPAFSQICEAPGATAIAGTAFSTATVTAVSLAIISPAGTPGVLAFLIDGPPPALLGTLNAAVISVIDLLENRVLAHMKAFWNDWYAAQQNMIEQLNASYVVQTQQLITMFDSGDLSDAASQIQRFEAEARKQLEPTDEGCIFDTAGRHMAAGSRAAEFVSTGVGQDLSRLGNNEAGGAASQGRGQLQKTRWNTYVTKFCDGVSNGGNPGCTAPGPMPNAHILPSKTLFAKETIDMANPDTKTAVDELVLNITGYQPPDPFAQDVLRSSAGKDQRRQNREYMAQMDAVSALVSSIVGERTPGPQGAGTSEVQALRQRMGVMDAHARPSEKEIRQSVIEQLWDPNYYVNLTSANGGVAQKEVYLQAYNLMLLHKIIEKTERIANVYALQTANILDLHYRDVRKSGMEGAPLQ